MKRLATVSGQHFKYPRTPHLPWSEGVTSDDKVLKSVEHFVGKQVVVTEKMDGENTTLYTDYYHARSLDSRHHPSRNWVKQMHATLAHDIPEGWRICGENLYAQHSITYKSLKSYFYAFSIWNDANTCLSWNDTEEWAQLFGLVTVPVLYRGVWEEERIKSISLKSMDHDAEGYVVRLAQAFHYSDFNQSIAKFVRKNHVQTDKHWMEVEVVPNKLATSRALARIMTTAAREPIATKIARGICFNAELDLRQADLILSGQMDARGILTLDYDGDTITTNGVGVWWFLIGGRDTDYAGGIDDAQDFALKEDDINSNWGKGAYNDVKSGEEEKMGVEVPVVLVAKRPPTWHPARNPLQGGGLMGNSFINNRRWKEVELIEIMYYGGGKRWYTKPATGIKVPL